MPHDHDHHHQHDHQHDHGHDHKHVHSDALDCCSHHDMDIERYLFVFLVGGVLAIVSWIAHLTGMTNELVSTLPAIAAALLLGSWLIVAALKEIRNKRVSSSSLAALAILAAMAVGKYGTAAFLAFILLVADQVVRRTASGAQRAIEQLVKLTPTEGRVVDADGTERQVAVGQIAVGATVRVRPGENLPVDGRVLTGQSSINQASLTGEAMPVEVQQGSDVYAGTSNLTGAIDIRVTAAGADTTIGKVSGLIREAESTRTPRQQLIEQVARFYVPVAIAVFGIVFFYSSRSPDPMVRDSAALRAVTVLVVTCPTALLLSSPSAMVAAFAAAARLGVMVKKTEFLESAATIDAVVMDKTGTLTTGRFEVSRLAPAEGVEGAELLAAAAAAEANSNHPLALSILRTARQARIEIDSAGSYEEIHGAGVRARTGLGSLLAGRGNWIRQQVPSVDAQVAGVEARIEGMSGVHVVRDGRYLGAVGLEDKVRPNGRAVVERLREMGVRMTAIFTGDRLSVGKRVGLVTGVDSVEAECLPEEKHELVKQLNADGYRVMMVGDGINDGPALAEADVGVAMGLSGSDIAANSAGVALMTDELNRLPFLIELARRTRMIVAQNIAVSILMAIIGLALAASGLFITVGGVSLGIGAAALLHFLPDVFVVANSFRLFRFGEDFLQAETVAREQAEQASRRVRREASVRMAAEPA